MSTSAPRFEDRPREHDVSLAKTAVRSDPDTPTRLAGRFPVDNDPEHFTGDEDDLRAIRRAMKRYEREEADMMEDREYYMARYRLQFVDTRDDEGGDDGYDTEVTG